MTGTAAGTLTVGPLVCPAGLFVVSGPFVSILTTPGATPATSGATINAVVGLDVASLADVVVTPVNPTFTVDATTFGTASVFCSSVPVTGP